MELIKTENEQDWETVSVMLKQTIKRLQTIQPLWGIEQITASALQELYALNELRFITLNGSRIGSVFLQEQDDIFWPECKTMDSLFVHKLHILPAWCGQGFGARAIQAIRDEAAMRCKKWLRLDCDDRPFLHKFYQDLGFDLVDVSVVGQFKVGRYQLLTRQAKTDKNKGIFPSCQDSI